MRRSANRRSKCEPRRGAKRRRTTRQSSITEELGRVLFASSFGRSRLRGTARQAVISERPRAWRPRRPSGAGPVEKFYGIPSTPLPPLVSLGPPQV